MNAIRTTLIAVALSAVGAAQASEITEFPLPASSNVTRAAVRAEAAAANKAGALRYDFSGAAVMPMSAKTREQVRMETIAARLSPEAKAAWFFVGGM